MLNQEIRNQIATADGDEFQLRAADLWLTLHRNNLAFLPPIARAFTPRTPNEKAWTDTAADVTLLSLLNRYCYRCHSNVAYHVFDKQAVFVRRNNMASRVQRGPQQPGGMPQDRILPPAVVTDLVTRLRQLQ